MISPRAGFTWDDVDIHQLDGEPPSDFDCGREEQTEFLYALARRYHEADLGKTYLVFVKGVLAAFFTLANDALTLGSRERGRDIPHPSVPALKLGQLAVDRRFQGSGLGRALVGFCVEFARRTGTTVGCRYLTLDAQPDLVRWYEEQGFVRNKLVQNERERRAAESGDPARQAGVKVSMRLDLRLPASER